MTLKEASRRIAQIKRERDEIYGELEDLITKGAIFYDDFSITNEVGGVLLQWGDDNVRIGSGKHWKKIGLIKDDVIYRVNKNSVLVVDYPVSPRSFVNHMVRKYPQWCRKDKNGSLVTCRNSWYIVRHDGMANYGAWCGGLLENTGVPLQDRVDGYAKFEHEFVRVMSHLDAFKM